MDIFLNAAQQIPEYKKLDKYLDDHNTLPALVTGVSHIHKAHIIGALLQKPELLPVLVIAESEAESQRLSNDINMMYGAGTALLYPAKELLLGDFEAASREYEHKRIFALSAMLDGTCKAVICSPEAAAQLTIPPEELKQRTITLSADMEISQEDIVKRLLAAGYSRCDLIEGAGQFSVRGGIVDIFPPSSSAPCRIELWGDTIDSISRFDLDNQRRTDPLDEIRISPAGEVLFDSADELCGRIEALSKKLRGKNAEGVRERLSADVAKMRGGVNLNAVDKYFPLCYSEEATVFDYSNAVFVCENVSAKENYRAVALQHAEDLKILTEEKKLCKGLDRYMLTKNELYSELESRTSVYFDTFIRGGGMELGLMLDVQSAVQTSPWSGEYAVLRSELDNYLSMKFACMIFSGTEKGARTLASDLADDGYKADFSMEPEKPLPGRIIVSPGTLSAGIEYPVTKFAVFTHTAVHADRKRPPKKKKGEEIRSLSDISIGDLVVHYSYGIGIFDGVHKIETDGVAKDYIKIRYAGADVLHIPVTQLDLVSRYIGSGDAGTVKLNKLNSDQWQKSKAKAKAAAKEMASELIELYSRRMKSKGYEFPPDDSLQEDFEAHFNYIETNSQLRCVDEIKADMMKPVPMERLLCGDVGFGKTEVALRAAFKCAENGKQCAILVPTTVLAWQHFQTCCNRMEGFPVNIALLSRHKTPAEQREILRRLKAGSIDILIGTHRIIQDDIKFKDLGLVIIDEEQRFGVAHKEKFKEMFAGVDVLTLSATPIPRTLNMAMSGIRDMSVIDEPPQDRQPITTYVMEHDWGIVMQAIQKELRRSGQVYYIHNRIDSIYSCAEKIRTLIPDARVGVAHGRMSEEQMLEIWRQLLDGDLDVLVCTTIIETGVDVPNVNTLIIENADYMGLAQLHQLRGRVGRTNKRAYAYFTFQRGKVLSEISQKRLDAIREFTQFGSGFRIAMRDLEIRGAGSILGASQSGHLANVGYDMYLQLLDEAVREERGEKDVHKEECLVDIKIDAYIPEDYISNQAQRVDCYRKIAKIQNDEDSTDVTDELIDRYGDPPKSVVGLIEVARLRNMASACNIVEISQMKSDLIFYLSKFDMEKIAALSDVYSNRLRLEPTGKGHIRVSLNKGEKPLDVMRTVITTMNKA